MTNNILIDELVLFSAGSSNDNNYLELWVKGAGLFIPQLNGLINQYTNYKFRIISANEFTSENTELFNIFNSNNTDKGERHGYHKVYAYILNKLGRNAPLNILEIGLGTNNDSLISSMGPNGRPGASLYAFREYLPNSNIYGADIDKDILFQSDRINTCYVDQLNAETFNEIKQNFGDIIYDLIIDDGLHSIGANFNTLLFGLNNLRENGWIVIEDIHIINNWMSIDFILSANPKFKTYIVKANMSWLYLVNKISL